MLNQLLKFTLVSSALLWLRPRWKGLLALIVFVLMVHVLHGEYLSYVELSENDSLLVWSYLVKWLALLAGVLVYFFAVLFKGGSGDSVSVSSKLPGKVKESRGAQLSAPEESAAHDGFDFLRDKKQLETRAEKLLNRE